MEAGGRKWARCSGESRDNKVTCHAEAFAQADQDGRKREGEGGKAFQFVAADVRRLNLKGLKARKKIAQGKRSETSAALGQRTKLIQALKGRKNSVSCLARNYLSSRSGSRFAKDLSEIVQEFRRQRRGHFVGHWCNIFIDGANFLCPSVS